MFNSEVPNARLEDWLPAASEFEEAEPEKGLKIARFVID